MTALSLPRSPAITGVQANLAGSGNIACDVIWDQAMDTSTSPDESKWTFTYDGVPTIPAADGWLNATTYRVDLGILYSGGHTVGATLNEVDPLLRTPAMVVAKAPQGPFVSAPSP